MSQAEPLTAKPPQRLEHFPISFFGMSMGVFGLALALRAGGLDSASELVGWFGALVFAGLLGVYGLKVARHPHALTDEWNHPIRIAFFPAISISLLLFAAFLREGYEPLAHVVWLIGAAAQGVLTVVVISTWISHRAFGPGHLSPAWFIPAVGNVIAPLAGAPLGYLELSWYFFSVGLLFWIVLLTLVFNRLIFHDPLPGKLRPTLVILIAPPAVAALAWLQLHGGQLDDTARILLNIGYVFTLIVAVQVPALLKLPFALSFWALSFPLAAITTASFRFGSLAGSPFHNGIGYALLVILVAVVVALAYRTLRAALDNEICVPE